jgi:hypothetical protein
VRTMTSELEGPIRGDDPAASMVGLWLTTMSGLSQLRQEIVPTPDEETTAGRATSSLVREIIQSRLRRRKRPGS